MCQHTAEHQPDGGVEGHADHRVEDGGSKTRTIADVDGRFQSSEEDTDSEVN